MKRLIPPIVIGVVVSLLGTFAYAASPTAGTSCAKVGLTSNYAGKKYTCIKISKKLVWSLSIPAPKPTTSPNPTPILTPTKTFGFSWPSATAKYIVHTPVDLSQILQISKYGSCAGHIRDGYTFTKELRTNLSLKHYLYPIGSFQGTTNQVKLFAPFDATVTSLDWEKDKIGGRPQGGNGIHLTPKLDSAVEFVFGHVYFTKSFNVGDSVKAGELIGFAALGDKSNDFDIDLTALKSNGGHEVLGSFFDHLAPDLEIEFRKFGFAPEQMSILASERDLSPCNFTQGESASQTKTDWVINSNATAADVASLSKGQGTDNSSNNSNNVGSFDPSKVKEGAVCDPTIKPSVVINGAAMWCKVGANGNSVWSTTQ